MRLLTENLRLRLLVSAPIVVALALALVGIVEGWDRHWRFGFQLLCASVWVYGGVLYLTGSEHLLNRLVGSREQQRLRVWRRRGIVYAVVAAFWVSLAIARHVHPEF